jgi:uncharacterized membrane protein YgcG
MTSQYWRAGGLAVFATLAAVGAAGCGGSSTPKVASLGSSHGDIAVSTTTLPKGNPTQLLDEWATCMRTNGVPDMADPTITSSGAIHIEMPADASASAAQSIGPGSSTNPCNNYLQAASQALGGKQGLQQQAPDPAKLLKLSECMQKSGFPQFPDPSASGGIQLQSGPGSTMNPNNPAFTSAMETCAKKAGVNKAFGNPSNAPAGSIEVQSGSGPKGGVGGNGGSGAVIGVGGGGQSSGGNLSSNGGSGG